MIKKKANKKVKRIKKLGTRALSKKCWSLMSKYVRARDDNKCFTCGKYYPQTQAGHYKHAPRTNAVSYDSRNIHAQCVSCNSFKSGNLDAYALKLEAIYGHGILQELDTIKKSGTKLTVDWFEDKIVELTKKLERYKDG